MKNQQTEKVHQIPVEYSDKNVSPWGGLRLVSEMLARTGFIEELKSLPLPAPGSNRGYNPSEIIMSFICSIWTGGNRLSHSALLRHDPVIKEIFNWKEVPSESTFSRFFGKFSQQTNNEIFPEIQRWYFKNIQNDKVTLDLDSTVIERYGEQEGSKKGYNPKKRGRPSHHPLMAFITEGRMLLNGWLRPGNTSASNNTIGFVEESIGILGNKKIGLLRADSGFFNKSCLDFFERKEIAYIIGAKFYNTLKRVLLTDVKWFPVSKGISTTEFTYRADTWKEARRIVAVRKDIDVHPKSTGHEFCLFTEEEMGKPYRYSMYVTNLELPAEQIWKIYRDRGDAENRIKDLKNDFAINGFCMEKFWSTEAAFRFALVAYNLMALFRLVVLKEERAIQMRALYFKCIAIGSWISRHSGKKVLKLAVHEKKRHWMNSLFDNLSHFSPPFNTSNA